MAGIIHFKWLGCGVGGLVFLLPVRVSTQIPRKESLGVSGHILVCSPMGKCDVPGMTDIPIAIPIYLIIFAMETYEAHQYP